MRIFSKFSIKCINDDSFLINFANCNNFVNLGKFVEIFGVDKAENGPSRVCVTYRDHPHTHLPPEPPEPTGPNRPKTETLYFLPMVITARRTRSSRPPAGRPASPPRRSSWTSSTRPQRCPAAYFWNSVRTWSKGYRRIQRAFEFQQLSCKKG